MKSTMFHTIKALCLLTVDFFICFTEPTTIPIVKLLGTKRCVRLIIINLNTIVPGCILSNLDLC